MTANRKSRQTAPGPAPHEAAPAPGVAARLLAATVRLPGHLPLAWLHAAGALFGRMLWHTGGRWRDTVVTNLGLAFPQLPAAERRSLARRSLRHAGRALFEVTRIWNTPSARLPGLVREVQGLEHLNAALASGKGLLIAAPHLGCWEILNHWLASQTPLAILYRPPRQAFLEPLLQHGRSSARVEQVRAEGSGVRALYRRLAAGGVVGILPDQKPREGEGVWVPFFGQPASTMVLLPRLARRTGATVVFAFAERLPQAAGYRIHILPAPDGTTDADPVIACTAMNAGVEACVRIVPEQYQWQYRRYSGGETDPYPRR